MTTISTLLRASITLGIGGYDESLIVTSTGDIRPSHAGAVAVLLTLADQSLSNDGTILGRLGTIGIDGGAGMVLDAGTAVNDGEIIGGAGGDNGGAGVVLDGGTLTNAGLLIGGASGGSAYAKGDAVAFGAVASTLVIDPGALFHGAVAANAAAEDVLVLGEAASLGILTGLGSEFTGFSAVRVAQGASWRLTGANSLDATLTVDGYLGVTGTLDNAGSTVAQTGGTLVALGSGTLALGAVALAGGSLSAGPSGTVMVGGTAAGAAGDLTVPSSASIAGFGVLNDTQAGHFIIDDGVIEAAGGALVLSGDVSGYGALEIGAGGTLRVNAAAAVGAVDFQAGSAETLVLTPGASLATPISGFRAGDVIELSGVFATGLSYQNGTLSLTANGGETLLGTLTFLGDYQASDFTLVAGDRAGTQISGLGSAATPAVTAPGADGSTLDFYVSGSVAFNEATDIAKAISPGGVFAVLSAGQSEPTVAGAVNEIFVSSGTGSFNLATGHQITFVGSLAPTTLRGSAAGSDSVIGGNGLTYDAQAGNDLVVFTQGNNHYLGGAAAGGTIAGGSGDDTIATGGAASTVFSGTGASQITLNDTTSTGDVALMEAGNTIIYADGVSDTVFASASGTIFAGAGSLLFTASAVSGALPVTIHGGSGQADLFGSAGLDITLSNSVYSPAPDFIAGAGNETLNGAGAAGGFTFVADTVAGDTTAYSVTGGAGFDYFSTGTGIEAITAGSGVSLFQIANVLGGTITINDFSAADSVNFAGLSVAAETTLLQNASTVSGGSLTVTLSEGTTVEFVGVTSLAGHLF